MIDPIYGDNPLDPVQRWNQLLRPPLVVDPEMEAWREVYAGVVSELLASSWLVRWRVGSVKTALGVHLENLGGELGFPKPDGWDDERYGPVVDAIEGVVLTPRTPPKTEALALSLTSTQVGQSFLLVDGDPLKYSVIFFGVTAQEAITYCNVLEYGRPKGVSKTCLFSPAAVEDVLFLDGFNGATMDGPAVMVDLA